MSVPESSDLSGLRGYAEQLAAEFSQIRRGLADIQREVSAVTATVKSADGLVSATVGCRGQLTAIDLDPRVFRRPDTKWLSDAIVRTVQQAVVQAGQRVAEICDRHAPDADIGSMIDGQFESRLSRFDFVTEELGKGP